MTRRPRLLLLPLPFNSLPNPKGHLRQSFWMLFSVTSARRLPSVSRSRSSTQMVRGNFGDVMYCAHFIYSGIASLEKLMHEFSLHHKTAVSPAGFIPKNGDLISAKFSDGSWYRARVKRASPIKKEAEVQFIDYGNHDNVAFKDCRPLDPKFRSLAGQAADARLSFVKLTEPESEYHGESIDRFRSLCEGRKLIANIDHKEGNLLHLRLIDPQDPMSGEDPLTSINADLVRDGLAYIDRKGARYLSAYPDVARKLEQSLREAKLRRNGELHQIYLNLAASNVKYPTGMFEYGDIEDDV